MQPNNNEFTHIDLNAGKYDQLFKKAKYYDKYAIVKARKATAGEVIQTTLKTSEGDTLEETNNTAKDGDFIITNPGGEQYIIKEKQFKESYDALPNGSFQAKGRVKAIVTDENVQFIAPWGEKMKILAGGYLIEKEDERYGIDAKAFYQTYRLAEKD